MSVVRIRESPYYRKKIYENFVETLETVRNREVSLPRGSTVATERNGPPSEMPTHCQRWL